MKTKIKYLLVLVLVSFVFAGCASMHESKMWEYKTLRLVPGQGDCDAQLNQAGKDGWKLIFVVSEMPSNGDSDYTFIRRKH